MITRQQMQKIIDALTSMRDAATDEQALDAVALYPAWRDGTAYTADERIRYGDKLFRCVQAHTSQSDWSPDETPALWVLVSLDEWPEWVQPTGAHDAYQTGDKVSHNGQHWQSTMDANIWEPGVYGWEAV